MNLFFYNNTIKIIIRRYVHKKRLKFKQFIFSLSRDKYKHRHIRIKKYTIIIRNKLRNNNYSVDDVIIEKILMYLQKINYMELFINKEWWLIFLDVIVSESNSRTIKINKFLIVTNNICKQNINCGQCLEMYYLCLEYGLYRAALIFRDTACKAAIYEAQHNPKNYLSLNRKFIAQYESEDNLFGECLVQIKELFPNKKDFIAIEYIMEQLFKVKFKSSYDARKIDDFVNPQYLSMIKDSRIAVVSRAAFDTERGAEIDSFDYVVRTNYRGGDLKPRSKYDGLRVDVSYYNGETSANIFKEDSAVITKGLKAAVFKEPVDHLYSGTVLKRHMHLFLDKLTFESSAVAIPNIVADLILHQPNKIKIFSADAFLTNKRPTYYGQAAGVHTTNTSPNYPRVHDTIANYILLYLFFKKGLIEGDCHFTNAMELGVRNYVTQLENNWLDHAINSSLI